MILDKQAYLSDPQTVTTSTNTGLVSEHTIDLGAASRDIGAGENMWIVCTVTTTLTMDASQDLLVQLVTDGYTALNSPTLVQTLGKFAANTVAGSTIIARVAAGLTLERYLGINYVVSTGSALSAGAVKTFVTTDPDVVAAYTGRFTIATS
jgi:hypothetical protein